MTTSNSTDPIIGPPGDHGFFMFGDKVLYISHMPMFTVEKHMYQVVLRVTLPDEVMQQYRADRLASAWNLTNTDDVFTLPEIKDGSLTSYPVDVFRDYSNADAAPVDPPLAKDVTLQVDEVVHFRHFDFDIPRPDHLTYLLFGRDGEAHLSHYVARDPDFQHIVTLGVVPDWLSADQLAAGVLINLTDQLSLPTPCQNPLTMASCPVLYQGRADAPVTLDLTGATTIWFSTGNMLNAADPCAPAATS